MSLRGFWTKTPGRPPAAGRLAAGVAVRPPLAAAPFAGLAALPSRADFTRDIVALQDFLAPDGTADDLARGLVRFDGLDLNLPLVGGGICAVQVERVAGG